MDTLATAFYETPWAKATLYIALAIIMARVVDMILARRDRAVEKVLKRPPAPSERTRYVMIRRLVQVGILFVGIAMALSEFQTVGILARAMLASAAIIAGIIGIASRAPIANLVSGVMIAFSQPVRLGDYVGIDDVYGTIEEIRLTYTFIRTADNRRVVIPNEAFASKVVNNYSMGSPGSMVVVTFVVPLQAPLDVIREAALEEAERLAPPPPGRRNSVDVESLDAADMTLRVSAWAVDPLERRAIASDLRAAILGRLTADGVIPAEPKAS